MKCKIFITFGVILCIFSASSCGNNLTSVNDKTSSFFENYEDEIENSNSLSNVANSSNDIYNSNDNENMIIDFVIPQSFEIYNDLYEIIIDYDKSSIKLDKLLGHIIYEKDLTTYIKENPNLTPVINNHFKCTGDKIAIYTIISSIDDSEMEEYLAIQYNIKNITKKEIFKLKEVN